MDSCADERGRCEARGLLHRDSCPTAADIAPAPKVRYADQGYRVTHPIIVHSRADIASILRAHRIASNETCEQFDARAGWSDRYVTKAEHEVRARITIEPPTPSAPDGEISTSFMAEVWLETAGLRLVLLPAELAEAIGAVPAPKRGA